MQEVTRRIMRHWGPASPIRQSRPIIPPADWRGRLTQEGDQKQKPHPAGCPPQSVVLKNRAVRPPECSGCRSLLGHQLRRRGFCARHHLSSTVYVSFLSHTEVDMTLAAWTTWASNLSR